MPPDPFINWVIIAVIVYFVCCKMWPGCGYPIQIVIDEEGIRRHKGLPKARERDVLAFLVQHVTCDGKVIIYARRDRNGYLRLGFNGRINDATRQQIRNFLVTVL